jgi:hypothetical protein
MESFFERFAELSRSELDPSTFARLGAEVGMTVLGPPLAISDPLEASPAPPSRIRHTDMAPAATSRGQSTRRGRR